MTSIDAKPVLVVAMESLFSKDIKINTLKIHTCKILGQFWTVLQHPFFQSKDFTMIGNFSMHLRFHPLCNVNV